MSHSFERDERRGIVERLPCLDYSPDIATTLLPETENKRRSSYRSIADTSFFSYFLGQHRTIWQEHSAKDFASYESYKRVGILYVFPPFITARMGQKIGRRPQTQLCGDALDGNVTAPAAGASPRWRTGAPGQSPPRAWRAAPGGAGRWHRAHGGSRPSRRDTPWPAGAEGGT